LIGNVIGSLLNQPLSVDELYFYNDVDLPKARSPFFIRLWEGVKSFFYSFFDTRYNRTDIDENTLEVWVGQSSLYLDIIQSMIDQGFTKQTGIPVKCSILADTSKIILANATNDNPDVVLSIDTWIPYSYALRGMLVDLSKYPDFQQVASHHVPNNFTTLIFEDGVYGVPETQSVYLLYYRKDIMNYLSLSVPDTWDDVISMLPILQSHKMNFYHPLGGESAFKGYGMTTPLIYQFGGEIYTPDGIATTLKEQTTVNAIRFITNLFTIYDLPLQISSFFEHFRSGDIPIGIATVEFYLQLKYAAPELSGQWGVTMIPGRDSNDDSLIERYSAAYGKASIMFANSDMQDEGWELIKWWNSTATQIAFMQNVKTNLGEKFLVISANMDALEVSVWDEEIKEPMLEQAWGA
jgi:ABC-type glycerol-3-phosphate transport system substrate-binding protein